MSTALYRRYRPETFADVIGQEHVTTPLITALEKNRVNHAYLFSGPRGCGKTTSARILARCLNCAEGPTPTPCGVCDSCRELSRDGGGSLDVIEMDAASHGGVDHARDLRERASFAPVRDRYKIFIIDEAHMVTREGFNALLKIVEEPPEHIKFIFATTEPNKVLGTIRSRTHHYPFRLVPPETLTAYLAKLADEEGVTIADGVLPLVVRAGGGSVRDSLSILDQLIAGATDEGVTYDLAVALLGFTHGELLDTVIDAFSANSAADVFASVDRVIQTGQAPRRFIEDLLERLRDLIIVKAVPDAAEQILHGASADQIDRLKKQAQSLGAAELSRAADITNTALNEMSGATNPQLHLELLCARIMLPSADSASATFGSRLDRLERSLASGQGIPAGSPVSSQQAPQISDAPAAGSPVGSGRAAVQAALNASRQKATPHQTQQKPEEQVQPTEPRPASLEQPPAPASGGPLAALQEPQTGIPLSQSGGMPPRMHEMQQTNAQRPHARPAAQGPGDNVVNMVGNSWREIIAQVPSRLAQNFLAQCVPSKFENDQLFIRAALPVLRQVKDHIGDVERSIYQVVGLKVRVRAEIDKSQAPQQTAQTSQQGNRRPPLSAPQSQTSPSQNTAPAAQRSPAQQPQSAPLAAGPRGGEQAWAAHGQPRSSAPTQPQWSQDDWNNPVTSWAVASIPGGNEQENQGQQDASQEVSASYTPQPTVASPATPQESAEAAQQTAEELGEATAGVHKDDHPAVSAPVETPKTPRADGADPNNTPAQKTPEQDATSPVTREQHQDQGASASSAQRPEKQQARPIAEEYGDYEGGYFDEGPADEPEYVAGVGYMNTPQQTAQAENQPAQSRPNPAPAGSKGPLAAPQTGAGPLGGGRKPEVLASKQEGAKAPQAPQKSEAPGKKLSFRERHAAQIEAGKRAVAQHKEPAQDVDAPAEFVPSDEDTALEETVLMGQKAIEQILGGKVIEETSNF